MDPYERFATWLRVTNTSQARAAEALGCHQTLISRMFAERRMPRVPVAVGIEKLTADWSEGPIRVTDWLDVEPANDNGVP